jgi:hypothetical protein
MLARLSMCLQFVLMVLQGNSNCAANEQHRLNMELAPAL